MWYSEDREYRLTFRYYRNNNPERIERHLEEARMAGYISPIGRKVAKKIQWTTIVTLQRSLRQGAYLAWAKVFRGYAFCSKKDSFDKRNAKQIAVKRMISPTKVGKVIKEIYDAHFPVCEKKVEKNWVRTRKDIVALNVLAEKNMRKALEEIKRLTGSCEVEG